MEGTTRHWGQEEATDMEEKLVVNLQISGEIRKKITKLILRFLFSEAPLTISKVQLSFPFSF